MLLIDEIFLSSDSRKHLFQEEMEGITDVIVKLSSGDTYIASFFTFEKTSELQLLYKGSNSFLGGLYFAAKNMVLIDNCRKETVRQVVEHLIEEGDFTDIFQNISNAQ